MLGDNLRDLRKEKGMSQEELATRINVVRQTVSKWEKNLSVPDAEILQRIAAQLDVSVEKLLGEKLEKEEDTNEVAQQLSRINEQLAVKNKRSGRIIKTVLIVIAALIIIRIILLVAGVAVFSGVRSSKSTTRSVTVSNEPLYDEEQLFAAMDVLDTYFSDHMYGCELDEIAYDEPADHSSLDAYAKICNAEYAVVMTSDFATDAKIKIDAEPADAFLAEAETDTDTAVKTFEPDKTYKGVKWLLTRSGTQDWQVQGYGY